MKKIIPSLLCKLLFIMAFAACNKKVHSLPDTKTEIVQAKINEPDTTGFWTDLEIPPTDPKSGTIRPDHYRLLKLDFNGIRKLLSGAPKEKDKQTQPGLVINIPMPEGNYQLFRIYETEVMAPELAAKFPEIKSFGGNGIADQTMSIRLDYSPNGFHGFIITLKGGINIDPSSRSDVKTYICYYKQDFNNEPPQRLPVDSIK